MATPSANNALVLPGNLRFSAGGLPVTDLTGAFLKSITDNGNNTYNIVVQLAEGSEDTVTVSATGGSGASITSGTADPTGGAAGDAYLQVNASSVITSIWRNISGTWTEFTLPAGGATTGGVLRHPTATYNAGATRITLTEAANDAIAVGDAVTFQIPPGVAGSAEIVARIGTGASQAIVDLAGAAVEAGQFTVASRVVLLRRTLNWIVLIPDVNASDGGLTTAQVNALIPPIHVGTAPATRNGNTYELMTDPPIAAWSYGLKIIFQIPSGDLPVLPDFPMLQPSGLPAREIRGIGGGVLRVDDLRPGVVYEALYESPTLHIIGSSRATETHQGIVRFATEQEALDVSHSALALSPSHIPGLANLFISDANLNVANPAAEQVNLAPSRQSVAEAVMSRITDAALNIADPSSESVSVAASRQAISEAIASLGGELGAVGPFHFRINQDATQTDSQAAHTLGGIYRNTSGRPLRVREAFVPVHPGGSGATEYNFYVWKVDRVSATSYMTDVAAGASESLRTTADGTTIGHDVARGMQSTLHGFTRAEVIIAPGEYFMVAVYRSVNGTAANTIVASGADVSQDYDGALEYVAKASFAGTYGTDPVEVYHNSTFAERMQLIFTFEDEGLLPPIHGIHRKEIPDGRDRFPFSDEGEATNPNAYVEWNDLLALVRNVSVYEQHRPQASEANLHDVAISAINQAGDICLDVPHRTTAATGTWTAITPGTDLEYVRVRSNVTAPVQSRYYYEYFTDEFWFGTDVGSGVIRLIQDDANDALASFLTSGSDTVVWLHHHATDAEALLALQTLATGHEAFYWNTAEEEIRKLTAYVPPGVPETGHHYQWVRLFGGPGGDPDGGGGDPGETEELYSNLDTDGVRINVESGFGNTAANNGEFELSRALVEADDDAILLIDIEYMTGPTATRVTHYVNHFISARSFRERDAIAVGAANSDHTESIYVHRFGNSPALTGWAEGRFIFGRGRNTTTGNDILRVAAGANSTSPDLTGVKVRVLLESVGGASSSQAGETTAGGFRRVTRRVAGASVSIAITDPNALNFTDGSGVATGQSVNTFDPVPLDRLLGFSATIQVAGRAGHVINLTREQVVYCGPNDLPGWGFTQLNGYTNGSLLPAACLFLQHQSLGPSFVWLRPQRQQVRWGTTDTVEHTALLFMFGYDDDGDNIIAIRIIALTTQPCEIEHIDLYYEEEIT